MGYGRGAPGFLSLSNILSHRDPEHGCKQCLKDFPAHRLKTDASNVIFLIVKTHFNH